MRPFPSGKREETSPENFDVKGISEDRSAISTQEPPATEQDAIVPEDRPGSRREEAPVRTLPRTIPLEGSVIRVDPAAVTFLHDPKRELPEGDREARSPISVATPAIRAAQSILRVARFFSELRVFSPSVPVPASRAAFFRRAFRFLHHQLHFFAERSDIGSGPRMHRLWATGNRSWRSRFARARFASDETAISCPAATLIPLARSPGVSGHRHTSRSHDCRCRTACWRTSRIGTASSCFAARIVCHPPTRP